ncbi:MAG TPA: RecX family transcriptional regulator [Herpetosiphonaceae bacterium]
MPPGTITALVAQAGDKERVNVFIDGQFAIGVSIYVMQDERLHKGQVLSQADWERLERAERGVQAWNAALRLLEARPRSEREIRTRLQRKEFAPEHIDAAIQRLRELELLDDAQFAKLWIANRQNLSPRGTQALRQELRAKGIDRQVVDETIEASVDADAEREACAAVARRALPKYAREPDRMTFQRKFGAFLQRRGFSFETIKPILAELWQEVRGEPLDD